MKNKTPWAFLVWGLVILLLIVHQDFWFWDDPTLVFGFMPIGLLYHAGISLAAAFTWYLATLLIWPVELVEETKASVREQPTGKESAK